MKKLLVLILSVISYTSFAQDYGPNGYDNSLHGHLHVLMVFVGDENETSDDDYWVEVWDNGVKDSVLTWAHDKLPEALLNNGNLITENIYFNSDTNQIGTIENVSQWYDQMSRGEFKITCDIYPELVRVSSYWNHTGAINWITANDPSFDWSKYDNRKNQPSWQFDNSKYNSATDTITPAQGDSIVDYIIFIERTTKGHGGKVTGGTIKSVGNQGYSVNTGLGVTITGTGRFNITTNYLSFLDNMIHEMGHSLIASSHIAGSKSVTAYYQNTYYGWGQTASREVLFTSSALESWYNGWNEITEDIKDTTDNGEYTISDFVTSGESIRIRLPGTNPIQHLWIENHQGFKSFDRSWFGTDANGDSILLEKDGIYMYVDNIVPDRNTAFDENWTMAGNGIKCLHAEGTYDYLVSNAYNEITYWWETKKAYDIKLNRLDPFGLVNNASSIRYDFDGDGDIYLCTTANGCDIPEDEKDLGFLYELDGVRTNYKVGKGMMFLPGDKIGLSEKSAITNHPHLASDGSHLDPIYINTISVEIMEQYGNGDVRIKVTMNENKITKDTRMTGELVFTSDSISGQDKMIISNQSTVVVDQTLNSNRDSSIILFNGETGFTNPSILTIDAGAELVIEDSCVLRISEGATLLAKNLSTIRIKGSGQLIIDNNAYINFEVGTILEFEDAASSLIVMNGNNVGINSILTWITPASTMSLCDIQAAINGSGSINRTYLADAGDDMYYCGMGVPITLGGSPAASGGTTPYTYLWAPSNDVSSTSVANPTTAATTAGKTFTLTVTDSTGCTDVDEILVNPPTIYIQNITISSDTTYFGIKVEAGEFVDDTQTYGKVIVNNGTTLTLKSNGSIILNPGFKMKEGTKLVTDAGNASCPN